MARIASEQQKKDALKLGLMAHENGLPCIPAQDKKLMEIVKSLSNQLGASRPLLDAWVKGWHTAFSPKQRVAALYEKYVVAKEDLLKDLPMGKRYPKAKRKLSDADISALDTLFHSLNRMTRDDKKWDDTCAKINKLLGYECVASNDDSVKKSDAPIIAKLQKMLHEEHLYNCDGTSCDINFAAENDLWYWAIEQFMSSGAASSKFKKLYNQLSPDFKKEAEVERKIMVKKPHKTCRHCNSVNWGDDVTECGNCRKQIKASSTKTIIQDVANLSSGTLSTLLNKEGVEARDYRKLDKIHQMFIKMVVGALDSDPKAYKDWKDAWNYFKKTYDLNTLEVKQGRNITIATTIPLDAEDAAASLLNRYFAKRSKALAETASKYLISAVTESDIQKMSSQTLLEKIRSGELTYTQVDVALEKAKKFSTLDWLGDKLAEDDLKNNTYLYIIDKDERGEFSCHVEDPEGKDVWSASNEESEDGEFYPVSDGFMKHNNDIKGLEKYLKELQILPKEAVLKQ